MSVLLLQPQTVLVSESTEHKFLQDAASMHLLGMLNYYDGGAKLN